MDYSEMWQELIAQLSYLRSQEVKAIDPTIVIAYMSYIAEVVKLREQVYELT
uniref:Uncharacterized protein n=1 Tax=viral metagenome TaxID=1070528 RepID=A0A6M3Y186_9ZZZZ